MPNGFACGAHAPSRSKRLGRTRRDVRKDSVERPRHLVQIECLDEETRIADLAAAAATHEPVQLLRGRPSPALRLLLERYERPKVAVLADDVDDPVGAERSN